MNGKIIITAAAGLVLLGLGIHQRARRNGQAPPPAPSEPVSTRRVFKPRLPAPPMPVAAVPVGSSADDLRPTNLIARLLAGGNMPKLNLSQLKNHLEENRRSAESLLAAFRTTGDRALLKEALEKYPNDSRVNFAALFKSDSPEERRQRLDAFKQSAPDNALANYLSAFDYFKSGQTDRAVQELLEASGKGRLQDYSIDFVQNVEEAYRAAGYSVAEAKAVATSSLPLPHLAELKQLSQRVGELANLYRQVGDESSAQAALQMALSLGERVGEGSGQGFFIQDLVGLAIQRQVLEKMDPAAPYDNAGRTVKDRMNELTQHREQIKEIGKQAEGMMRTMSEQDLITYFDRLKLSGEMEAMRWALNRQGQR